MSADSNREIFSAREINAPVEKVYEAFVNPLHLQKWWGPEGFTNTIHEFDLRPTGKWILTMHGPEKGNYENSSVFETVVPNKLVAWHRISQPIFAMEVGFEKLSETKTRITFKMIFDSVEASEKIRRFAIPNNEENFDRLERVLEDIT